MRAVESHVRDKIVKQVRFELHNHLEDATLMQLYNKTEDYIRNQVWTQIQVKTNLKL
jgi:hypothetical protein